MNAKERLIIQGIEEIRSNGIQDFSMRKVAAHCGLSSGAPYKHFRDNQEFILEIVRYINDQWHIRQKEIIDDPDLPTRRKIVLVSVDYIRFLVENPEFRTIIMISKNLLSESQQKLRLQISAGSVKLIEKYCQEVNMPPDVRERKTFTVRAIIYGAALMIDNGGLECDEDTLEKIEDIISREVDAD